MKKKCKQSQDLITKVLCEGLEIEEFDLLADHFRACSSCLTTYRQHRMIDKLLAESIKKGTCPSAEEVFKKYPEVLENEGEGK